MSDPLPQGRGGINILFSKYFPQVSFTLKQVLGFTTVKVFLGVLKFVPDAVHGWCLYSQVY